MTCPRCGHENNEGDRFCANCGARLTPIAPPREEPPETSSVVTPGPGAASPESPEPTRPPERPEPSRIPPPVTPSFASGPAREEVDEEWRMSSLGPPPRPRRRVWLWIIVALFAIVVIACCAFLFFVTATDTGQEWFEGFATQVVEEATQQAE